MHLTLLEMLILFMRSISCPKTHKYSNIIYSNQHPHLRLFCIIFARAATPNLCKPSLFTQIALFPSTTATTSSAILCANMPFPLPLLFLFDAASKIQLIAVQRLRRRLSGIGKARATPPPAAPRCWRILRRGAMLSIARER
jgi:hypothetical protein